MSHKNKDKNVIKQIVKGAAGVAAAAGIIAAGVALSQKSNREKLKKGAKAILEDAKDVASKLEKETKDAYKTLQKELKKK